MSKKKQNKYTKKIGQAPGTLIYTGEKSDQKLFIESFDYSPESISERELSQVEEAFAFKSTDSISWININGLNHIEAIQKIGTHFQLHPLILEDIVSVAQRPKLDEYDSYLFVIIKMLYYDNDNNLVSEQVSFILGNNYVISFQESDGDVFDGVRDRIRTAKGRIRQMSADYLMYALLDAVVDHYFTIVETLGDKIEDMENELFASRSNIDMVQQVQELKREILKVRRAIFPFREVISKIDKYESTLIHKKTKIYFRDIYDHIIQVTDHIDIYREMIWSLMDMHMTNISNRMNEVMKVLTIMASIFIPLTFIAGIYGMNFDNIPELKYQYSYFILWGIMIVIVVLMVLYFKRKKWL